MYVHPEFGVKGDTKDLETFLRGDLLPLKAEGGFL
jgi:hypothetical protein